MNTISKCNKKAWEQIILIRKADNMKSVKALINTAIRNTFGLNTLWMIEISINNGQFASPYSYTNYYGGNYGENFEALKAVRNHNCDSYGLEAMEYFIQFIPERLKTNPMYKELIESLNK